MTLSQIPHLRIVVATSAAAIIGYAAFSIHIVGWSDDKALIGDTIGTWKSFAVLAFGFWIGSSSAGKAKDDAPSPKDAKEAAGVVAGAAADAAGRIEGQV